MNFKEYIRFFSNKNMIYPGEHHFVALCLVPLMIHSGNGKIEKMTFINPDGSKSLKSKKDKESKPLMSDITYDGFGIEVKYSKNDKITFTTFQIDLLINSENFLGIVSIINVANEDCRILYISKEKFIKSYSHNVKSAKKERKLELKSRNHSLHVTYENGWTDLSEEGFRNLFKLKKK